MVRKSLLGQRENDPWAGLYWFKFLAKAHYHALVDEEAILNVFNLAGTLKEGSHFKHPGIKVPGVECES
jgi:hypothetical protein